VGGSRLAFLGPLVPLVEEGEEGIELGALEVVADLDVAGGAGTEVLVQPAREIRDLVGQPAPLAGGSRAG